MAFAPYDFLHLAVGHSFVGAQLHLGVGMLAGGLRASGVRQLIKWLRLVVQESLAALSKTIV
jgi:hypothetical protein